MLPPALTELVEACRILGMEGHGDKTLGHVSVRDPHGRGFWLKRASISLAEVAGPEDLLLVDFDGRVRSGVADCPVEWPIHSGIYRARPDVNAIGHTHAFNACLFAATEEPLEGIVREGSILRGRVPRFRWTANPIIDLDLGDRVANTLGRANVLLMRNHGMTFCGRTTAECVITGIVFEQACKAQLAASASNYSWSESEPEHQTRSTEGPRDPAYAARSWNYLRRKLGRYDRRMGRERAAPSGAHKEENLTKLDHMLARLAMAHRMLGMEGHGFQTIGSVALRDPGGNGFWTKRSGISMDEVSGAAELVLMSFDGKRLAGGGEPPINWQLRAAILEARPDVNVVVYSRGFHSVVFSAMDETLLPIDEDGRSFDFNVPVVHGINGAVNTAEQARRVVHALGNANALFIKNVGMVALGARIPVTTLRAIALEKACRMQLAIEATGYRWSWISNVPAEERAPPFNTPNIHERFWHYYRRKLDRFEAGAPLPGE